MEWNRHITRWFESCVSYSSGSPSALASCQVSGLVSYTESVGLELATVGVFAVRCLNAFGPPLSWDIALFLAENIARTTFGPLLCEDIAGYIASVRAVSPHEYLACFSEPHLFSLSGRILGLQTD